jgi:predicted ATPase
VSVTIRRIAVSGGPGAGKTTLWREIAAAHPERIVAVPEVATLMLTHVFPSVRSPDERRALQRAIFAVQRSLEQAYESRLAPGQLLLCDRGVPDGGGYWPDGHAAFFDDMRTQWQAELGRYEAVVFMESAAVGGWSIAHGNAVRSEDQEAAVQVDRRLRAVWAPHPKFHHVPQHADFAVKLTLGKALVADWL